MDRGNLIIVLKIGEAVDIGDDITVTLLSNAMTQARISIEAPKAINICRQNAINKQPKQH